MLSLAVFFRTDVYDLDPDCDICLTKQMLPVFHHIDVTTTGNDGWLPVQVGC